MHKEARGRTGLEEPGCAGIEVYAHEVEGRAALLVALEGQRHVHEPGRKLCGKARFEQACRQLCGKVAVYCRGRPVPMPSQSIIWAAAALQNCWTASPEISPRAAAPAAPNTPEQGLFGKEQGGHPLQEST